jgi:hypothetical protein
MWFAHVRKRSSRRGRTGDPYSLYGTCRPYSRMCRLYDAFIAGHTAHVAPYSNLDHTAARVGEYGPRCIYCRFIQRTCEEDC